MGQGLNGENRFGNNKDGARGIDVLKGEVRGADFVMM